MWLGERQSRLISLVQMTVEGCILYEEGEHEQSTICEIR
jgi:hypothetical protein